MVYIRRSGGVFFLLLLVVVLQIRRCFSHQCAKTEQPLFLSRPSYVLTVPRFFSFVIGFFSFLFFCSPSDGGEIKLVLPSHDPDEDGVKRPRLSCPSNPRARFYGSTADRSARPASVPKAWTSPASRSSKKINLAAPLE